MPLPRDLVYGVKRGRYCSTVISAHVRYLHDVMSTGCKISSLHTSGITGARVFSRLTRRVMSVFSPRRLRR